MFLELIKYIYSIWASSGLTDLLAFHFEFTMMIIIYEFLNAGVRA